MSRQDCNHDSTGKSKRWSIYTHFGDLNSTKWRWRLLPPKLMSNTCTQRSGFQQKLIIGIRLKSGGDLRREGLRRGSAAELIINHHPTVFWLVEASALTRNWKDDEIGPRFFTALSYHHIYEWKVKKPQVLSWLGPHAWKTSCSTCYTTVWQFPLFQTDETTFHLWILNEVPKQCCQLYLVFDDDY